jgi:hypothetical protein
MQKQNKTTKLLNEKTYIFFPKMHLMLQAPKPTHGRRGEVHHFNKQQIEARNDER